MAYPEQAKTLVGIVPPETVQDFRCRVAYEVVASAAWDGDYTSDVSLVWQIAKAQEIAKALGDTPPTYTEPDAAFVARSPAPRSPISPDSTLPVSFSPKTFGTT